MTDNFVLKMNEDAYKLLKSSQSKRKELFLFLFGIILMGILIFMNLYSIPLKSNPKLPDFIFLDSMYFAIFQWEFVAVSLCCISIASTLYSKRVEKLLFIFAGFMIFSGIPIFLYFSFIYSIPVNLSNGVTIFMTPYSTQAGDVLIYGTLILIIHSFWSNVHRKQVIYQNKKSLEQLNS